MCINCSDKLGMNRKAVTAVAQVEYELAMHSVVITEESLKATRYMSSMRNFEGLLNRYLKAHTGHIIAVSIGIANYHPRDVMCINHQYRWTQSSERRSIVICAISIIALVEISTEKHTGRT